MKMSQNGDLGIERNRHNKKERNRVILMYASKQSDR